MKNARNIRWYTIALQAKKSANAIVMQKEKADVHVIHVVDNC
ncbi:MAG: hypothetical protein KatS3mg003_1231 [Candidatus Nitrosocaldaceae archaeon]|nr:MAG: hypothetical protein KatS3mg003_1231 [Candidatus Nitrosocaldaceae archaeon]